MKALRPFALLAATAALAGALASQAAAALPDGRAWEMVSPIEKNGGSVAIPGALAGGGVLQASGDGDTITYSSSTSFSGGAGAPEGSQYIAARFGGGWGTENVSAPLFSGTYGDGEEGVPYQLFSSDLGGGLLLSGRACRSLPGACPVANPPLSGTDAPSGYQNYYLRRPGSGFEALLGQGDVVWTGVGPESFELTFAGATPDLAQVALSTCAALTAEAVEAPLGEGCDLAAPNLYLWSAADGLRLVNEAPGATLGAQSGAISSDGSRVYFEDGSNLLLRDGNGVEQVDATAGGGGAFETAGADGAVAYFTKEGHLWRYDASAGTAIDLTPSGGVLGVLGASADGSFVYYVTGTGLFLNHGGTTTKVTAGADSSNYPPATGTARVSADGSHLAFLSSASLTGYNNLDQKTGLPDVEVYFYDAGGAGQLRCVSCRPNGLRPTGSSTIPGAVVNGGQAGATALYKPRALSADGSRVFFDSRDAVVSGDTNNGPDVYQWEALGPNCVKAAGCISLLSSGRSEMARFADASLEGDDVFFLTDASLVDADPGSVDLYDARVGGGFPEPLVPIPCFGDSCQSLPSEPIDPTLTTQISGPGNPKVHYVKQKRRGKHCKRKAAGKCKKPGRKGRRSARGAR